MITSQELGQYVSQARAHGMSDEQIRQDLFGAGWQASHIDAVFSGRMPIGSGSVNNVSIPLVVKILAILLYIGSGFFIVASAMIVFFGTKLLSILIPANSVLHLELFSSVYVILLGVLLAGFGAIGWLVASSLFKARNWARLSYILFSFINLLFPIIFYGIFLHSWLFVIWPVGINGLILWYLFSQKVKLSFNSALEKVFTKEFIRVIFATILLCISLIGIFFLTLQQSVKDIRQAVKQIAPQSSSDCDSAQNDLSRNYCYLNLAGTTKDFSYCEKITGETDDTFKANCYGIKAAVTKDLIACATLTSHLNPNTR